MITIIKKRPWLLIVAAFLILISAWTALITIAVRNQPKAVPLEHSSPSSAND